MSSKDYRKYEEGDDKPTLACLAVQDDNFISTKQYSKKYGIEMKKVTKACQKGTLIAESRMVPDPKKSNALFPRWFVYDIPLNEHPKWEEYQARVLKRLSKRGTGKEELFDQQAPQLLDRFDEARKFLDHTRFKLGELSTMLQIKKDIIRRWTEIGVDGYGKLPRIRIEADRDAVFSEDGKYQVQYGNAEAYYDTKDVRRFLKKELADPRDFKKFKTLDDAMAINNADEIAEEHGFYRHDPNKVAPKTYEGFIKWAENNVWVGRGRDRKPFRAGAKQREFYKTAFVLDKAGRFKHKIICASRPRGDYKSFDVTLLCLFRFFNMPEETIFFVTNSVEQTTHLLYKEAIKVIKNSPTLSATPGLDIQRSSIYLMSGKGKENIYSSIEMISAEGGARSNATCFACSEVWKLNDETNIAEIEQSIRGVDDGWFLAESTVAPRGHFFHRYYEDYLKGDNDILYFQYYNGDQRQNPKIDEKYLNHVKRVWPFHYKMFFGNNWDDAATGLFPEERILEMGHIGMDGIQARTPEYLQGISKIIDLGHQIRKLDSVIDVTPHKAEMEHLRSKLIPIDSIYKFPGNESAIESLEKYLGCDFVIGIGVDRAMQLRKRADRTVVATVARGMLDADTRIYFILDLFLTEDATGKAIFNRIIENSIMYGSMLYVDIEEYQGLGIYEDCIDAGLQAELVKPTFKHQEEIFTELYIAADSGLLKCPTINIWTDDEDRVMRSAPPIGKMDILRTEMSVFESVPPSDGRKAGYFGSPYKRKTGSTKPGEAKDDTVYALAHAVHAAMRGDIPASVRNAAFAEAIINKDVVGAY